VSFSYSFLTFHVKILSREQRKTEGKHTLIILHPCERYLSSCPKNEYSWNMCLLYFHCLATQASLWCLHHLPFGTRYIHHASSLLSVETVIWLILKLGPIVEAFSLTNTVVGSGRSTRSNLWLIPGPLLDAWWKIAERHDARLTSYISYGKIPTAYTVPSSLSLENPGEESETTIRVSMAKAGIFNLLTVAVSHLQNFTGLNFCCSFTESSLVDKHGKSVVVV
jgi:hypothetical protein